MKRELSPLQIALSQIPGWEKIEELFENMPDDAESEKREAAFAASTAHDLDYDMSLPLPPHPSKAPDVKNVGSTLAAAKLSGTTKVSIRIPTATLFAFKHKAKLSKLGYQTLINQVLKSATA